MSKSQQQFVVVNCGQLLTLAGSPSVRCGAGMRELGILHNAALLVRDGKVALTGPWKEIKAAAGELGDQIDAAGRLVAPGFVDAHTHSVFAGNRVEEFERRAGGESYQSIAASGGGILSTVRQTRAASEDELEEQRYDPGCADIPGRARDSGRVPREPFRLYRSDHQ